LAIEDSKKISTEENKTRRDFVRGAFFGALAWFFGYKILQITVPWLEMLVGELSFLTLYIVPMFVTIFTVLTYMIPRKYWQKIPYLKIDEPSDFLIGFVTINDLLTLLIHP
jgi:hypothetical protein